MNAVQATIQSTPDNHNISEWLGNSATGQLKLGQTISSTGLRTLATHEHLFVDGESQTHFFQVRKGVVGVYKLLSDGRRQIVTFCYPGDFIGLDRAGKTSHHAEALCPAVVRSIPVKAIDTLIRTEPGFGQAMLDALSAELAESREQLMALGRKSALEKVATFLVSISRRNDRNGQDPGNLHIPMTRCDIADYLGLTIETVSRNFTKLKVSNTIRLGSNSTVEVLDSQKLELLAEEGSALTH